MDSPSGLGLPLSSLGQQRGGRLASEPPAQKETWFVLLISDTWQPS